MRQFDVFATPGGADAFAAAVVVLSSHLVSTKRVLVAPLMSDVTRSDRAIDVAISSMVVITSWA